MPSNCSYWKAIPEVKQFTTDVLRSQSIFAFSSYSLLVLLIKLAICFVSSLTTLAEKKRLVGLGGVLFWGFVFFWFYWFWWWSFCKILTVLTEANALQLQSSVIELG